MGFAREAERLCDSPSSAPPPVDRPGARPPFFSAEPASTAEQMSRLGGHLNAQIHWRWCRRGARNVGGLLLQLLLVDPLGRRRTTARHLGQKRWQLGVRPHAAGCSPRTKSACGGGRTMGGEKHAHTHTVERRKRRVDHSAGRRWLAGRARSCSSAPRLRPHGRKRKRFAGRDHCAPPRRGASLPPPRGGMLLFVRSCCAALLAMMRAEHGAEKHDSPPETITFPIGSEDSEANGINRACVGHPPRFL